MVSPSGSGSATEIIEVEFPAGASVSFKSHRLASVDQFVWVLEGEMEMTVGETKHRLAAGDCLHMRLDQPIRFRNPAAGNARYAVVLSRNGATR